MTIGINKIAQRARAVREDAARREAKAQLIFDGANPVQRFIITDLSRFIGVICPRRSGKTFANVSKALHLCESKPGARVLIISLTLKSTVENYWSGAPGGLFAQNHTYDLGIKFNTTRYTWVHPNGSRGMLAGAETKADIEHLRGAAAEADLVIIDECKSFAPSHLNDLVENVVEPGLMTRGGQMIMSGTPGSIPMGPFYEATCVLARNEAGKPTCIEWDKKSGDTTPAYRDLTPDEYEDLYSLHSWTIQDNLAAPHQWRFALSTKRRRGWSDDHPTWRREYLGEWVNDASDLVYAYAGANTLQECNWKPDYERNGITGLPESDGPWHLLLGLDLGFVDDSAMVLIAYSEALREVRHVYDFKAPGMDSQAFTDEVLAIIDEYGQPEMIVADFGGGGARMLIETLNQRYGLSIQAAEKKSKNDHIELLNGDFLQHRIKIIAGSDLEHELCGLQWDLSNDAKHILARTGRLREDPSCPNHLCDALLYIWRFSYHYYSRPQDAGPEKGSNEWMEQQEELMLQRALSKRKQGRGDPFGLARLAQTRPMTRETMAPSPWVLPRMSLTSRIYETCSRFLTRTRLRASQGPASR